MTWLWIILSVAITAFLLRDKKIAPHNFLWALIPIDRYGIDLMGFTIKPVYIYCIILVAYAIITKNFRMKIPRSVFILSGFFILLIVLSMLFRGNIGIFEDIKVYGIMFLNFILAATSLSLITGKDDLRQIRDVLIATAVGYGIVFIGLYALDSYGIVLNGVTGTSFWDNSVFKLYNNVTGGTLSQAIRLRGFYLEPNSANVCFIVGYSALLGTWIKNGGTVRNSIYAIIMLANIVLTSSRSALIVALLITLLSIFRLFFAKVKSRRKIIFLSASLCVLFLGSVFFVYSSSFFSYVYDNLIARYLNRSALNDTVGRFSIWKEALTELIEGNWFAGLGVGAVIEITEAERDAHNTIIEVMCTSGVFVGIYYTFYFIYPFAFGIKRRLQDIDNAFLLTTFLFAYFGIFLLLTTISNIASVYLSFFAFLLYLIPGCLEEETERLNSLSSDGFLRNKS